jgi:hypothetical protein
MNIVIEDVLRDARAELKQIDSDRAGISKHIDEASTQLHKLLDRRDTVERQIGVLQELMKLQPGANGPKTPVKRAKKAATPKAAPKTKAPRPLKAPTNGDWVQMSRVDAISHLIQAATEPISRTDLAAQLGEVGRKDEVGDISATLSYLARTERIKNVSYGKWTWIG